MPYVALPAGMSSPAMWLPEKSLFTYIEPSWDDLIALLGTEAFLTNPQLWGDLPETYPEFAETLGREIKELELKWPV